MVNRKKSGLTLCKYEPRNSEIRIDRIDRAAESANQTYCLSLLLSTEDGGSDHCLNEVLFTEGGGGFIWGRYHQGVPDASDHLEATS